MIALPPGYSAAIWPAAGIAIASCVLWKAYTPWVGVFIGSLLININIGGQLHLGWLPVSIALGTLLQTIISARIIRYIDPLLTFDKPETVIKSMVSLSAGCIIASLLGNAALAVYGMIPSSDLVTSMLNWWMGDFLGAVIFIPLTILVFDRRPIWRSRRIQTGLPLVIGFLLCVGIYYYADMNQRQQLQDKFQIQSNAIISSVETFQGTNLQQLVALASLFDNSEIVTEDEFIQFGKRNRLQLDGFKAWAWSPLIAASDKQSFESATTAELGRPFNIKYLEGGKPNADGWLVPVKYVQPMYSSRTVLGLDLNSESARAAAIAKGRSTLAPVITGKIQLAEDPHGLGGTLLLVPG
jgi:hypothetical protein